MGMFKKKQSRHETSKDVRRVLNRSGVDLSYCIYSCYGLEVRLTGWLCKTDGSDYTIPLIEAMIEDFQRNLPGHNLIGDFENWSFSTERISYVGDKEEFRGNAMENEFFDFEFDKKS